MVDAAVSIVDAEATKVEGQRGPQHDADTAEKNSALEPSEHGSNADEEKEAGGGLKDFFRVFRYTDRLDRLLYGIAFTGAIINGTALPLMTLVFGSSTSTLSDYSSGKVDPKAFQDTINHLILYFVYLFVARFVIGYVCTLCICIAAARTTNSLRKAFLSALLRQDISHFDMHSNGSAAVQVTTNGNRINQGIAEKLYSGAVGLSLFFSAYIVALAVQWKLALITMSIVPAIILAVGSAIAIDAPIESRIVQIYSRAGTVAQDALASIKTIRAFGAQDKIASWYDEYLQRAYQEGRKKSLIYGVLFSCQTFLTIAGTALAFWQGFHLFQSGEIPDIGTVFTVVLSVTLGATSVASILPQVGAISNASSAAAELFRIIDKPSLIDPLSTQGRRPDVCAGEIEFRDVHFAYPTRSTMPVIQGLNLSIPAGKTTALVGPSGCGKSTLVGLLERWYQPATGNILLDGCDIADYNTKWLRSHMKLVQQESTLFQGTVFRNVAKGFTSRQLDLSEAEQMGLVQEACKAADAHAFVEALPAGYHTQLGEAAGMLSGGQRQRLSIARSIISDPRILLCDEATSALDPRAEKAVQDALHRVSAGKTTLVIAHKLATVMAADNIAVMADGKVIEQGNHHELLERDGLYAAMVRAQDLGAEDGNTGAQGQALGNAYKEGPDEKQGQVRPGLRSQLEDEKHSVDQSSTGTMGYSLLRCIAIMLGEHPDMYAWYALICMADLLLAGTFPVQAYLFAHFINVFSLQGSDAERQANFYALMVFVLALANLVGFFCVGIACNTIGQMLTYRYRGEMLRRILNFDQEFFDHPEHSSQALTAKLSSVPTQVQELMSANLGLMITVVGNVIASSVMGIAYGWKLGIILVVTGLVVIVGSGYIRIRLDQKLDVSTEKLSSSSAAMASEAVASIRTISLLTREEAVLDEYSEGLDAIVAKAIRYLVPTLIPYSLSQSADFLVIGLGFWYGSQLVAEGEYTTTQFFIVFISVLFGHQAAAQFFTYTTSITKAKGAANYMLWLRTVQSKIGETDDNRDRGPSGHDVSVGIDNVEFHYQQRPEAKVLRGVSTTIEPGTSVAFVGPSGCGKSTVMSLLERFYDPVSGRILLHGNDVSLLSPSLYRRCTSLVQQEPPLYMGSIRDNIALGLDYQPSDEDIREACQQANALDFVTSLPEDLNTPCGSKGLQFSGGQRQRIAVARALIRKPQLLLLDEATSALDTQSERAVQKALEEAASSRTTIAVAHRLSTIRHADVIYVMEDGRIAEAGTHDELQRLKGRYHAMCLAQTLDQAI